MQTISEYPALPGDLIGFQTRGAFAFLVRLGQRISGVKHRGITHVAIVVDCAGGDPLIVQSVRRVNSVRLSSYGDTPHVVIPFPSIGWGRNDVVAFATAQLGRKYGVMSVISRAINCLTPKFINFNHAGDMDCSALAARAFEHGGAILPWPDPWQVTPGQLADQYIAR